jgi:hypothetical protein
MAREDLKMEDPKAMEILMQRQLVNDASIADGSYWVPGPKLYCQHLGELEVRRSAKRILIAMMVVFAMSVYFVWANLITPWVTSGTGQLPMKHTQDRLLDFDDVCNPFHPANC